MIAKILLIVICQTSKDYYPLSLQDDLILPFIILLIILEV